jgi:hypothetical protein
VTSACDVHLKGGPAIVFAECDASGSAGWLTLQTAAGGLMPLSQAILRFLHAFADFSQFAVTYPLQARFPRCVIGLFEIDHGVSFHVFAVGSHVALSPVVAWFFLSLFFALTSLCSPAASFCAFAKMAAFGG